MQSGVDKIRLTGGEPLIRKDVEDVLRGLRRVFQPKLPRSSKRIAWNPRPPQTTPDHSRPPYSSM